MLLFSSPKAHQICPGCPDSQWKCFGYTGKTLLEMWIFGVPGESHIICVEFLWMHIQVPRKDGFWSTDDFGSDSFATSYEAELITPLAHVEQDRAFFLRLDAEKLKVDTFYTQKEGEYCAQALRLEKQLLALFEVQEDLARQSLKVRTLSKSKDHENSSSTLSDSGEVPIWTWWDLSWPLITATNPLCLSTGGKWLLSNKARRDNASDVATGASWVGLILCVILKWASRELECPRRLLLPSFKGERTPWADGRRQSVLLLSPPHRLGSHMVGWNLQLGMIGLEHRW